MAALLVTAAGQHVDADLAFLDLAEEQLLGDETALAELAEPAVTREAGEDRASYRSSG